ncbi:BQ5605_C001g00159 [Microbotryum silenes-dioicae]|uniref:BQ5605_C001g00159 protein n=1 Tax=Microbotryum silenes-dioicae TaxID=796604 RepID=A0A2X0M600_9BASI|nr:BQ5605_C001g00159 [Microbotryum silenes-dioicae]
MARQPSRRHHYDSDEEPTLKSHKENRQPLMNASAKSNAMGEQRASNTTTATKRKPQQATAQQRGANKVNNANRKGRSQSESELAEDEEDDQVVLETQAQDDEEDEMEVDVEPRKKSTAQKGGKNATTGKKGKAAVIEQVDEDDEDDEDDEEPRLSAREKRMLAKLELTQKNLKQTQEAFAQLSELRTTKAEESEAALTQLASERQTAAMSMIDNYKHENDSLRNELASLRARRAAGINVSDGERVEELLHVIEGHAEEKQALQARISELEEYSAAAQLEERRKLQERDHKWQKEMDRIVKAKDDEAHRLNGQLKMELKQARQELEAEVEHSKTLQARAKNVAASAATTASSSSAAELSRTADELATIKRQVALSEDLTGFSVVSVKQEDGYSVYSAILNDYLTQTGGLTFKLAFYDDGTCGYNPDVDPERDAVLANLLPAEMQRYMRFDADLCSEWFRRLWFAVNKLKA